MSVPLDRLYHYIESIAQEMQKSNVIIYRFFPHGSKKIEDLHPLRHHDWVLNTVSPQIYCNDQEPLDFEKYKNTSQSSDWGYSQLVASKGISMIQPNFRNFTSMYDKSVLLHSEQRSKNIELYKNSQFVPAYYWSHAIIARDWFRYAEHLTQKKSVERKFLIYNRAWSGTREYRLGFADRLIRSTMVDCTRMRVSPVDSTITKHYDLHQFERPEYRPTNVIENYFPISTAESTYSADFDISDYEATDVEVVLETLFDDQRLHLTEKILRPVALGQPFILAGTYGSLKYLREYGFKTFSDCWDESYDMMSDSTERMNKILEVMKNIASWGPPTREHVLEQAQEIADYNKQHFFSKNFFDRVTDELKTNLNQALLELEETNTSAVWLNRRKLLSKFDDLRNIMTGREKNPDDEIIPWYYARTRDRTVIAKVVQQARQYYLRTLSPD